MGGPRRKAAVGLLDLGVEVGLTGANARRYVWLPVAASRATIRDHETTVHGEDAAP